MIRTGISMLALVSFLAAPAVSQTAPATYATSAPTAAEAQAFIDRVQKE